MNILFDKTLKRQFIESQELAVDSSGYLIDAGTRIRVKDDNKEFIKAKNFGGIRKGSRIFLSEDIKTVLKEASLNKKNE